MRVQLDDLPPGAIFDDAKDLTGIFPQSKRVHHEVVFDFEQGKNDGRSAVIDVALDDITITQPNITQTKVERFMKDIEALPPIKAVVYDDEVVVFDGHHRLAAAYFADADTTPVDIVSAN